MGKKTTTIYIRNVNDDYMQIVREFALHRRMSVKCLVLAAIDEYMTRRKARESKQKMEVKSNAKQ